MSKELEAVKQNQKSITEKEGTIATLAEAISKQESIIEAAVVKAPENRDKERENLHAAVVLGSAKPEALAKLDAAIAEEKKIHGDAMGAAEKVTAPAQAAIPGLERMKAEAEAHLASLTKERARLLQAMYMAEAGAAGEEYIRVAGELHALLRRLAGLNEMIEDPHSGERNLLAVSFVPGVYAVPKFAHPIFDSAPTHGPHHLHHENQFRASDPGHSTIELRAAEAQRLRELGVEL